MRANIWRVGCGDERGSHFFLCALLYGLYLFFKQGSRFTFIVKKKLKQGEENQ